MPLEFSPAVDTAGLHVRVTPNQIQKIVLPDEHPHKHSFIEFHYIYSGEETVRLPKEKKELLLREGQMAVIPYGVFHCAETKKDHAVMRLCFHLSIDESATDAPLYRFYRTLREATILEGPFLTASLERCRRILEDKPTPLSRTREGVILLDVILDIFSRFCETKEAEKRKDQTKLRQKWLIEEHIGTRYHAPDGLAGLAKKLFLSQRQTRKLVRQFFGEDYKTLIIRQRMEMAQILLEERENTLEEVAESVGYRSYSGFHLAFVRTFGQSPGEYRRAALEKEYGRRNRDQSHS